MYSLLEKSLFWAIVILSIITIGAVALAGYIDLSIIDEAWEVAKALG